MSTKINHKAIAGMYHADKRHKSVLTAIAAMPRQNETLVETLDKRLHNEKGLSHRDIVDTLKLLQEFGAGEFIPGRRGHPSRFKWAVDSIHVSSLDEAFPTGATTEEVPISGFTENLHGAVLINHKYALRPDLVVSLQLPTNLTLAEVERLTLFLRSLPFLETEAATLTSRAASGR